MAFTLGLAIYLCYGVGVNSLKQAFKYLQENELSSWLTALYQSEISISEMTWEEGANRFWKPRDSNELMHLYYRGMPAQFLKAFQKEKNIRMMLDEQKTTWMLEMFEEVKESCNSKLKDINKDDFDSVNCHRLQVFPALIAAQCISIADYITRNELGNFIATLLKATQTIESGYTESACDQINQIIPQILTDQLLAGPISWHNMLVSDHIIDRLIVLGSNPDMTARFETGLALSLQFLAYYRLSLESSEKKHRFKLECRKQAEAIDKYFSSIRGSNDPLLQSIFPWLEALRIHTKIAGKHDTPFRVMVRQSSSVVISRYYGSQKVPYHMWQLCVLNNLRAAHRSLGLPDCDDRRKRVIHFLSDNGVTKENGHRIIRKFIKNKHSSFYEDMFEFVGQLPQEVNPPIPSPSLFSTAHGLTMDELWSQLSKYRTWKKWGKHIEPFTLPAPLWGEAVIQSIWPIVKSGLRLIKKSRAKKQIRTQELKRLINNIIDIDLEEK